MNYKFINIKTPNSVILNSALFQDKLNQPQLLKLLYSTNLIVSLQVLFKIETIRLKGILNTLANHFIRLLFPTKLVKKIIATVF